MVSVSCVDVCSFRGISSCRLSSTGTKFSGGVRSVARERLRGLTARVSPWNTLRGNNNRVLRRQHSPQSVQTVCGLRSSQFSGPAGFKQSTRWPTRSPSTRPSVSCNVFSGASGSGRRSRFPFLSFFLQVAFFYFLFKGGAIGGVLKAILWVMVLAPVAIWLLVFFGSRMMTPGKCPNCGLQFSSARGKKQFRCPSCSTVIEVDKSTKQFVRAAPSWEQGGAGAYAGAGGAYAGASGASTGAGGNAGGAQAGKDRTTNQRAPGSVDIIDVEVLDVKDVNNDRS